MPLTTTDSTNTTLALILTYVRGAPSSPCFADSYGVLQGGYTIVSFNAWGDYQGRSSVGRPSALLSRHAAQDEARRPDDAFLRWHYQQAILANVRGAG